VEPAAPVVVAVTATVCQVVVAAVVVVRLCGQWSWKVELADGAPGVSRWQRRSRAGEQRLDALLTGHGRWVGGHEGVQHTVARLGRHDSDLERGAFVPYDASCVNQHNAITYTPEPNARRCACPAACLARFVQLQQQQRHRLGPASAGQAPHPLAAPSPQPLRP
jgi:hypothetical protein